MIAVVADTTEDASVKAMVGEVDRSFGRIDILVNCAAVPGGTPAPPRLDQIDDEAFFSDMNTKVIGHLRCIREVAPYITRSGWGRIINLAALPLEAEDRRSAACATPRWLRSPRPWPTSLAHLAST